MRLVRAGTAGRSANHRDEDISERVEWQRSDTESHGGAGLAEELREGDRRRRANDFSNTIFYRHQPLKLGGRDVAPAREGVGHSGPDEGKVALPEPGWRRAVACEQPNESNASGHLRDNAVHVR